MCMEEGLYTKEETVFMQVRIMVLGMELAICTPTVLLLLLHSCVSFKNLF